MMSAYGPQVPFTALPVIAGLLLACAVGFAVGWRSHGGRRGLLFVDVLQAVIGAALAVLAYALTGPLQHGALELILVALIGAWVWLGVAHVTTALLTSIGTGHSE
jgi:hypothetical protein